MPLKLKPIETFWAPVLISAPGVPKPFAVDFEFVHKTKDQLRAYVARVAEQDLLGEKGVPPEILLGEVIRNWRGLEDEPAYSESSLRDLINNYPAAGREIFESYKSELAESKRKNS